MNYEEFQAACARTAPPISIRQRRENCALGLVGEFGEVCDLIKKAKFHGHDVPAAELAEEIGDVMWYLAECATLAGETLESSGQNYGWPIVYTAQSVASLAASLHGDGGKVFDHVVAQMETIAEAHGLAMAEVMTENVEKLKRRYPDGFSETASRDRQTID